MQLKQTTPSVEPITLAEARAYLKVDYTDEDTLIGMLISAVREEVEKFTGLALSIKTIEVFDDEIPESIALPYPDHNAITEVKINGEVTTDYYKTGLSQFIITPANITTTGTNNSGFYCKYTTLGTCPVGIKIEMLKIIDEKYRNRGNTFEGSISELNENAYANLAKYCLQ